MEGKHLLPLAIPPKQTVSLSRLAGSDEHAQFLTLPGPVEIAPGQNAPTSAAPGLDLTNGDARGSRFRGQVIATVVSAAALLCGVLLRWLQLARQSLWFDEGYTQFRSTLSLADIVRWAKDSDFAPLYFFLQHYWGALFGDSEFALRALSALLGTVSLPTFYLLARKVLKDRVATAFATWLFAFSMMQLWYSQEARYYALLAFLALAGLYALILFLERRSVALFAVIVLSSTASLYTHNMMLFYLLALNLTWLTYPSQRTPGERFRELLLADALAFVLYLPWVPTLWTQATRFSQGGWPPKPTVSYLLSTLNLIAGFNLDYVQEFAIRLLHLSAPTASLLVAVGMLLLYLALLIGGIWHVSKTAKTSYLSLVLYCFVPLFLVFAYSRVASHVFIDRVFINSSAVLPILFAYPLSVQKGPKGRILYGLLAIVLAATTALSGYGQLRHERKEDWRGATAALLSIPEKNRMILVISSTGEILFDYYARSSPALASGVERVGFPLDFYRQFPPAPVKVTDQGDIERLKQAAGSGKYSEIDLVLSHEQRHDPNRLVFDYLNRAWVLRQELRFTGIKVFRFAAPGH